MILDRFRRKPRGLQVRLANGGLAEIPSSAIKWRGRTSDGLAAWAVQIPDTIDARFPPEVHLAVLPRRTQILIEYRQPTKTKGAR